MSGLIEEAAETAVTALAPEAAIPAKIGAWMLGDAWRLVAIGALAAVGVQQARIEGVYLRPHIGPVGLTLLDWQGWKPRARSAEAAMDARLKAEKEARTAQIAANHQPAVISRQLAEETDAQAPANAARVDDAVAAYAHAHPVAVCLPRGGATGLPAGAPGVPGQDRAAQGGNGANVAPDMVAISRADLDGFAGNTRDLDALRAYLAALIAKGVAMPDTQKD